MWMEGATQQTIMASCAVAADPSATLTVVLPRPRLAESGFRVLCFDLPWPREMSENRESLRVRCKMGASELEVWLWVERSERAPGLGNLREPGRDRLRVQVERVLCRARGVVLAEGGESAAYREGPLMVRGVSSFRCGRQVWDTVRFNQVFSFLSMFLVFLVIALLRSYLPERCGTLR